MTTLTRDDVETYLGEVSDQLAARVMATGASPEELAQAAREIELGTGEPRAVDSPRVDELCRILVEAAELEGELWPDE